MDRRIVYPVSIPQDTDILTPQQDAMIALGWVIQAVMGTATGVVGLACTPSTPASMTVNVGEGAIWMPSTIEATSFGSLAVDASPLMKLGINKEAAGTNFTLTAPGGAGTSINYLIEGTLLEQDTSAVVLPYVNAANPAQPYSGPNNTGVAQNTTRAQIVELQLKAGTAANTGTQTTPAVDTGYVPLYVITVNYGQSTITSSSIATATAAPFVPYGLPLLWPGFSHIQTFTSSGIFTVPAGVTRIKVTTVGGGGGGAGNTTAQGGGGGGAGGTGFGVYTVTPGTAYTVTVGAAGSAGAGGTLGVSGGNGGTSSFGALVSSTGGAGGALSATSPAGGSPGTGTGGQVNLNGGYGTDGSPGIATFAGSGGASYYGGGGRSANSGAGTPGQAYGSGGGSAYSSVSTLSGGLGAAGIVVVEW